MPSDNAKPVTVITSTSALVSCVPYVVGFVPHNSLVIVFLSASPRHVVYSVRFDLLSEYDERWHDYPAMIDNSIVQAQRAQLNVDRAHVMVWSSHPSEMPHRHQLRMIVATLMAHGVDVADVTATDGRTWYGYSGHEQCCPVDGHKVDVPDSWDVRFDLTRAEISHASSREQLEEALVAVPSDVLDPAACEREISTYQSLSASDAHLWRRRMENSIVDRLRKPHTSVDVHAFAAPWAAALREARVREPIIYHLCVATRATKRRVSLGRAQLWLTSIVRILPDPYVAPVAATLAALAWQAGDGAFATIAADRALAADRDNVLAGLIMQACWSGLPPCRWADALRDLGVEYLRGSDVRSTGHIAS